MESRKVHGGRTARLEVQLRKRHQTTVRTNRDCDAPHEESDASNLPGPAIEDRTRNRTPPPIEHSSEPTLPRECGIGQHCGFNPTLRTREAIAFYRRFGDSTHMRFPVIAERRNASFRGAQIT
jgi:hypothetical protein